MLKLHLLEASVFIAVNDPVASLSFVNSFFGRLEKLSALCFLIES